MRMDSWPALVSVAMTSSGLITSTSWLVSMSAAVTMPGPFLVRVRSISSRWCIFMASCLRLSRTSTTSSCTPSMLVYSWSTPSISASTTAQPGMEDKRIRLRALPNVWPKPRSSGSMVTLARVRLSGWTLTTRGRKNSLTDACMGFSASQLLGIELDDQVFVDVGQDVVTVGQLLQHAAHLGLIHFDPFGESGFPCQLDGILHPQLLLGLLTDRDLVPRGDLVGRNIHHLAIHRDALVAHELARFGAGGCKTHPVADIVQAAFEQLQQVLTSGALLLGGPLVIVAELPFEHAVHPAQLLLFAQLQAVVGNARATLRRPAGRHLEFALGLKRPDAALQEQVGALATGELALRSQVSSHSIKSLCGSDPALLGRPAAVVGDRGHVLDVRDTEAHGVERTDGRLASWSGALDANFHVLHAVFRCGSAGLFGSDLRRERRALARTAEAAAARRRPGQGIALAVGDRDDRVVEGGMDMRNRIHDLLLDLLAYLGGLLGHSFETLAFAWVPLARRLVIS